jgi:hypothetical protein
MTGFRDENHLAGTRVISRGQTKLSFKLRLLALVLALILTWYSLNPSLKPTNGIIRDVQAPDEQKRNVEPYSMPATLPVKRKCYWRNDVRCGQNAIAYNSSEGLYVMENSSIGNAILSNSIFSNVLGIDNGATRKA